MRKLTLFLLLCILISCSSTKEQSDNQLSLWYKKPATVWTEALPVGNGRLGAMIYGGVEREHIQFNEETLWTGEPHDYSHKGASEYLGEIRQLLFEGKQREADQLAMKEFMSVPLRQKAYQPFGDLYIEFPSHQNYTNYCRKLDLNTAVSTVKYVVDGIKYSREVFISNPDQVIVIHLTGSKKMSLNFSIGMDAEHENKSISTNKSEQTLDVAVKDGVLFGKAIMKIDTDGKLNNSENKIDVSEASRADIYLSAATNYKNYKDVSNNPKDELDLIFTGINNKSYKTIYKNHLSDYSSLYKRFELDLGESKRDSLPIDERLRLFWEDPVDPELIALYVQYGRYLMISSSRKGTYPANLQGIWNDKLRPPWDSKYTTNANTGMNYWPAELTNLGECHDPLFKMIEECAQTGAFVAREHYDANGWVLHHNTDIWRGTAPINAANHGIWQTGGAWLSYHFWEHYLYTLDKEFLKNRAWPIMKGSALFFTEALVTEPKTGWLISSPSNSPENGGLVAGPTMDHQIIRSLFKGCVEAGKILNIDQEFTNKLSDLIPKIAPNQIGRLGQLQEWLEDVDNPDNHHRHISHLWGIYPGSDINWENTPDLFDAAKQSLIFRGDAGTGWSLAWKINYWARFLDGNRSYKLIKMLLKPVENGSTNYMGGGGSYINLFDAHPPFQIDGNFGGTAGIIEILVQSHLNRIDLLPALPDAFPDGKIKGVCVRGGFELAFSWEKGKLNSLEVLSKAGQFCKIQYGDKNVEFETEVGGTYNFDGLLSRTPSASLRSASPTSKKGRK